jgi:hypothetical protein
MTIITKVLNALGKHSSVELQKTAHPGTAHILTNKVALNLKCILLKPLCNEPQG